MGLDKVMDIIYIVKDVFRKWEASFFDAVI